MNHFKSKTEWLIAEMAYFNESNPDTDPKVNKMFAKIRQEYQDKGYCLKYGKCEICGEWGLLCEIGLSWACEHKQECKEKMDKRVLEEIKEFHNRSGDEQ